MMVRFLLFWEEGEDPVLLKPSLFLVVRDDLSWANLDTMFVNWVILGGGYRCVGEVEWRVKEKVKRRLSAAWVLPPSPWVLVN